MTHTNHRQGNIESLRGDWVVLMMAARGINDQDAFPKFKEFLRISRQYDPVNAGVSRIGTAVTLGWQKFIDEVDKAKPHGMLHVVFDSVDKVALFLKDLVRADLGISVVVSGLHAETDRMCREAGTKRHTVQHSLGVWGKTELLPDQKIMDITTMCGHALISSSLVRSVANDVQNGSLSLEQAATKLAGPCVCGIFNTSRAQALIQEYIAA